MAEQSNKKEKETATTATARTQTVPPPHRHELFEIEELKVPRPFQGFIDFIREQGVVGLGVGFVVGTSASTLVKSIVTNIFNPLIGLALGSNSLSQKAVCLRHGAKSCAAELSYGMVISDLITFVLILFLVYFLIRGMRLEKIDKKKK
jgi:large conductance mechanosensitive channel